MSRGPGRAGFTLIEALVALMVLALVMVAVQRGFVTARIGVERAQSTLAAEAVARSIVETELDRLAAAPGVRQGETDGLAWTVTTEPIDLPLPPGPPPRPGSEGRQSGGTGEGQGQGQGQGDAGEAQREAQDAARWRPMRVTVSVENGLNAQLTVETLHLAKAEQ